MQVMPRPTDADIVAIARAEGYQTVEASMFRLVRAAAAWGAAQKTAPGAVSREDFDFVVADRERAKRLLVAVYNLLGKAATKAQDCRDYIERQTGNWFVWGMGRDAPVAEPWVGEMARASAERVKRLLASDPGDAGQPARKPDDAVPLAYLEWLRTDARREGVGGNEAWNAGVAWARANP